MNRNLLDSSSLGWAICGIGIFCILTVVDARSRVIGFSPRVLIQQALGILCIGVAVVCKLMKVHPAGEENEFAWTFIALCGLWLGVSAKRKGAQVEVGGQKAPLRQIEHQKLFSALIIFAAGAAPLIVWKTILWIPVAALFGLAAWTWGRLRTQGNQ